MKRRVLILVFAITLIGLLSSCKNDAVYEKRGIENYDPSNSNVSISCDLLPSDDFLEIFEYVDGDYYYVDKGGYSFSVGEEQEIMYLVYEAEEYEKAKKFTCENLLLSSENKYSYNGYEFVENIYRRLDRETDVVNEQYPYWFNMVAFNDEKNTIVFLGFYMPESQRTQEVEQLLTFEDMGAFLRKYFSFYDFDA